MTYTLVLHDEAGRVVSSRVFKALQFDGPMPSHTSRHEEYHFAIKAREMYRDAAHAVGKFRPWMTRAPS
jgi:hypothetical protein